MASTDARPVPIKNTAFRAVFPILDADGDLVSGATGLDSEVSKDQGTFADCTNEATEIATSSGMYYLDLTSTEMNADCVSVIVKTSSSGAKTTVLVFYPVEAGDIDVDVTAWNGTAVSSPATAGIPEVNVKNINNVSASSVTTVNANQGTTQPINFTGTGASALAKGDMVDVAGAAVSTSSAQIGVNVVNAGGTAWGSGAITAASIATDAITNAKIAANAIGASEIADGAIDAATFAAGAITASAIAADAIGASELAADAATEIGTAVWATAARTLTAATNITSTGGTTVPQTGDSYARLGAPAGASVSADVAAVKTDTGNILTKLLKYVQLIVRKDAAIATDNATELTAINANGGSGGGSFDNTTDSEQAIRDNMTTPPTAAAIADAVWEEAIADHSGTTGSTAEALNSAGSAGDPWTTALPGAYGAGSAGKIIGDNINATISSRASQASVDTIDDYVDTEVAAIKAKTDLIPASPAATSDIPSAATIADAVWDEALSGHTTAGSGGKALADIDGHTDTEIAAIKAKTDSLTFTTAGQVDAQVLSMAANTLTAAATASDFGTEVATAVWASATRTLSALGFTLGASDLAADTIGASELAADGIAEIVNAVLTTAMTESYNADGAAPTLAQALFVTMQRLTEFAISGTTITVKKLDGSSTAYTLTLDDATSPTSTTRAT